MRILLLIALLALSATPVRAADYEQAPGSSLVFAGTYQGEVFSGHFPGFRTSLHFDPADLAATRLEVDIPLSGVTTGNPDYDGEMRGESFFNVTRYMRARYVAEGARQLEDGRYATDGVLDLRGVSHPVTLTFSWDGGQTPTLTGRATVDRLAFNVGSGDWAGTSIIPAEIAISTKVVLRPSP